MGYGTEAFSARIKYAFDVLGLREQKMDILFNNENQRECKKNLDIKMRE